MIEAKIIADSLEPNGNRLTTMRVTFPRFILAELNTHRMFSKNSASSRAIPFEKMVKSVQENPFIPIAWQKDHKGMQGNEYITDRKKINTVKSDWLQACESACDNAKALHDLNNLTKQLCNRLLEPFMWHTVLITASEWDNFFNLRCPQYKGSFSKDIYKSRKDAIKSAYKEFDNFGELDWLNSNIGQAEIHMMALAEAMWDAMNESTPKKLKAGEWHIPFGDSIDENRLDEVNKLTNTGDYFTNQTKIKIATARCARVSYTVVGEEGKEVDYEKDIKLHDMLAKSGHWSPFEHCARAMSKDEYLSHVKTFHADGFTFDSDNKLFVDTILPESDFGWCNNFRGFIQYRELINKK